MSGLEREKGQESPLKRSKVNQLKLKKPGATWPAMFDYAPDKGGYLSIAHVFIVLIMQAQLFFTFTCMLFFFSFSPNQVVCNRGN